MPLVNLSPQSEIRLVKGPHFDGTITSSSLWNRHYRHVVFWPAKVMPTENVIGILTYLNREPVK